MVKKYIPIADDEAISLIAEGVHTGLRKGTDALGSARAWSAIKQPDSGWEDAVTFCVEGLTFMGYKICTLEDDDD